MQPSPAPSRWTLLLAGALLALAALAAYANTFSCPFIFDDVPAITDNATIRHLGRLGEVLAPPAKDGSSVSGRPMVNLSLAVDYAISGTRVGSYHATNLAIHLLAVLALFGIVRRTLVRFGWGDATRVAFLSALLWAVHPLLTESVTCVVQRTESLMGLFYLLTLYGFIRGTEADDGAGRGRGLRWYGFAWLACVFGTATKEVTVTAPVILLL